MTVKHNFRKLEIWTEGISLVKDTYALTSTFPKSEIYGLSSQIQRCAVSIPSNIAEGCSKKSEKHTAQFIETALGSAFEWETQLVIAFEVGFISDEDYKSFLRRVHSLQRKIIGFKMKLNK